MGKKNNKYLGYDTKKSDFKVPVTLKLWGIESTRLLSSLQDPLWPGVVAPDKGPIYGLNTTKPCVLNNTDFFKFKLRIYARLNCLK